MPRPFDRKAATREARAEIEAAAKAEGIHIERRQGTVDRYCATWALWAENLALLQAEGLDNADADDGRNARIVDHGTLSRLLAQQRAELGLTAAGAKRAVGDSDDADLDPDGDGIAGEPARRVVYKFKGKEA